MLAESSSRPLQENDVELKDVEAMDNVNELESDDLATFVIGFKSYFY